MGISDKNTKIINTKLRKQPMNKDKEQINEFDLNMHNLNMNIINLVESFRDELPPYEIGFALITQAVSLLFTCAQNDLLAFKTIMAAVDNGIDDYKKYHKD